MHHRLDVAVGKLPRVEVAVLGVMPAELLKTGKVQVLLGQKYFGWGSEPVKILAGIKAGHKPEQTIIDSGVDVVTRETVDAYVEQWKKWETGAA